MNAHTRLELAQRIAHASSEAEAAMWGRIKELFPEATTGDLPPEVVTAMWGALDLTVRAWCIENVPGAVEALANFKTDSVEVMEARDERDQT